MKDELIVSLVQPDIIWESKEKNLHLLDEILSDIDKSDLIVLPEMFATGFSMDTSLSDIKSNKLLVSWMQHIANDKKSTVLGSMAYRDGKGVYNRAVFAKPGSTAVEYYDKRHLFSHGKENLSFTPGNQQKVIEYQGWKIFPQICYDLRFPVWARNTMDYHVYINMSNWPAKRDLHWQTLLKARAIENQVYAIGVNRVGTDGNNIVHIGNSLAFDFDGSERINLLSEKNIVKNVVLSKDNLLTFRKKFNTLNDRDAFQIMEG